MAHFVVSPSFRGEMKLVERLHELQTTDSTYDADRERLARVEAELADRSELLVARRARDERAAALQRVEADQRDLELEVETLRGGLDAIEKKLYGGRVGDAKELTNLTREAEQSRKLIAAREDRLLELFEAADRATAELSAAEARLRELATERRAREAELTAERDRLQGAIGAGETARAALRDQIDAAALRTYDNLRRTRGGLAIAEVRQRTCQGCRISLPAGEEQRARHWDALVFCQSCGRILYVTA